MEGEVVRNSEGEVVRGQDTTRNWQFSGITCPKDGVATEYYHPEYVGDVLRDNLLYRVYLDKDVEAGKVEMDYVLQVIRVRNTEDIQ